MKNAKQIVRLPQRSEEVTGDEKKGMNPIAAAQKRNPTMHPAGPKKPKPSRSAKKSTFVPGLLPPRQ
jgi:hypothetical protein